MDTMFNFRVRAALAICLTALLTVLSWRFLLDDALIYFRYMRNALQGYGLVFNPGEPVNALTSPLYTYLLLVVSWTLGGHIHLAASVIFFITMAATCVLAERAFTYAGMFLASMSFFYCHIGMETSLLLMLLILALTLYQAERWNWLPLVLILLLLTRAEAGAFIPVFAFWMYKQKKWPALKAYIPALLVLILYICANYEIYHALLPQSSSAKLGQGLSGYWGKWPRAFLRVGSIGKFQPGARIVLPIVFITGVGGMLLLRRTFWNRILLPATGTMLGFYIIFNIPNYQWYYAPFLFVLVLYSAAAAARSKALQIVLLIIIVLQTVTAARFLPVPEARIAYYHQISAWLDSNASANSNVEACEIGELGWTTRRRVIDIIGLTEPKNAQHIAHRDVTSWLQEDRPDYIVMHRVPFTFEQAALSSPEYERAPVEAGDTYLLRRKGVKDRSNLP